MHGSIPNSIQNQAIFDGIGGKYADVEYMDDQILEESFKMLE